MVNIIIILNVGFYHLILQCIVHNKIYIFSVWLMLNFRSNISPKTQRGKPMTKTQANILASFMEENTDLARGIVNASNGKRKSIVLWEKVTAKLNSVGPPVKTLMEWKKVRLQLNKFNIVLYSVVMFEIHRSGHKQNIKLRLS